MYNRMIPFFLTFFMGCVTSRIDTNDPMITDFNFESSHELRLTSEEMKHSFPYREEFERFLQETNTKDTSYVTLKEKDILNEDRAQAIERVKTAINNLN